MTARRPSGIAAALCFLFAAAATAQYRIDYVDKATVLQEDKAHPEMTWYWPSFWETPDGVLHFLAHGGDGKAHADVSLPPETYRCGFKDPGIDNFYGADYVNGQWQTPADESCPAFWGEYERCGYSSERIAHLEDCSNEARAKGLCDQLYAPIGPIGSPSVLRIDHNGSTRYVMAYSGGNGDYLPAGIHWAVQENGVWKKYPADGNGPILRSKYWDCEYTFDPTNVVQKYLDDNKINLCWRRRWDGVTHGLTTVDLVYDENDRGSGANADGTIYFFLGYIHAFRHKLNETDDPKFCPPAPDCTNGCGDFVVFDSLVYRINYDPASPTGLGSNREIFMLDRTSGVKKWMPHSGVLVWDYDLSEFGEAPTTDPLCYPQQSTNIWPGNIDIKWNPDTNRWLSIGYFGETDLASLSNHKTQENTSLAAADAWTAGPLSQHNGRFDRYENVEISELTNEFPSNYNVRDKDGNIIKTTYIGYGGGLWYGTLGGKKGMWYFVPVRKKIFGPDTGGFVGLAIVPTLLKQCAYTMPYQRGERVPVSSDKPLSFTVTTSSPGCGWNVETAPWIHSNVISAAGTQTITFTIDPALAPREGSVSIAGRQLTFVQNPCLNVKFTVTPTLVSVPATRTLMTLQVSATANCPWTAEAVTPGITFDGPPEGVGSGVLKFYVEPNGGPSRTLTLKVAGIFVVIQQANGCAFAINPASAFLGEEGGTTLADVLASNVACTWAATSDNGFVTFPFGSSGTGSGQLRYVADRNSGAARTAKIFVSSTSGGSSASAYVNQNGQGPLQCPVIAIQPTSITVERGQDADIRFYATGTNLRISWIVDGRDDSNSSDAYILRGVQQSHTLQAVVSNACNTAFTDIVTVSVVDSTARCALPEIYLGPDTLVQPAPGFGLPMSITARHGDPGNTSQITYQWYLGQSGDTSVKLGLTSSSFTDAPIYTTFYWATATDSCGTQHSITGAIITPKFRRKRPAVRHDFSGDDKADLLWRNYSTGENQLWIMNGTQPPATIPLLTNPNLNEQIQSIGDLNGDEKPDLVWRNTETGANSVWLMDGPGLIDTQPLETRRDRRWSIGATADLDGDDVDDIVWHNDITGENEIWFQDGLRHTGTWTLDPSPDPNWKLNGTADFNGDQQPDLFFRNYATGANVAWLMDGARTVARIGLPATATAVQPKTLMAAMAESAIEPLADTQWIAQELSDYDGDGLPDITWRHAGTAQTMTWKMSGTTHSGNVTMPQLNDPHWQLQGGGGRTVIPGISSEPRTAASIAASATIAAPNAATIVTARLTSQGTPLAGRTLELRLNGALAAQVLTEADGSAVAAVAVGTLGAGMHSGAVTVAFAGDTVYAPATTPVDVTVGSIHPTLSWATPAPIIYGTPLGTAQLNATADVAGTFAYAPPAGTLLDSGVHTLSVTFTPSAPGYDSATASVTLTVAKATPNIVWPQPAPIVYGTPLGAAQLNAAASVAGTLAYAPPAGTVLGAGAGQTLSVHFTPADARNYEESTAATTIDVARAKPILSWPQPASIVYGTPLGAAQLNATADAAGTFAYTPAAGTIFNAGAAQTLSVRFTPADAHNYEDAAATTAIDVAKAQQTLAWTPPSPIVYGTVLGAAQLSARVTVAGPAAAGALVYAPPAGTVLDSGAAQTLRVTALETANYEAATASVTFDVLRAPLSARAADQSKLYGAPLPPLTGTLAGIVNGDAITAGYSTVATSASPAGMYPIAVALADPNGRLRNYDVTLTPGTLTVTPAPLLITADSISKQYSDPIPPLTASFRGFVLGETPAVLGGTLSLQTAATPLSAPGTYPISIGGLSSPNYAIGYAGGTLTVTAEDARVALTSPLSQTVSGSGRVTLTATVKDISATDDAAGDTAAGDIRKATLTFVDRSTDATLCTAPIALLTPSDTRVGTATCAFTGGPGTLTIGVKVGGYYTRDAAGDDALLTLATPTDDFVTGGGTAMLSSSAGAYAADAGSSAQFTVDLKYDKSGAVKGDFRLAFTRGQRKYELTDLASASYAIERTAGGGRVAVIAAATLRDVTSASAPSVVAEGVPLIVTMTDDGEPAVRDALSVALLNPDGGLLFAAAWNGTRSVEATLRNGNIAVHTGH